MIMVTSLGTNIISTVSAAFTDSYYYNFSRAKLNLFIEQNGSSLRLANRLDNCSGNSCSPVSCEVQTPDGTLYQRTACDQTFSYNGWGTVTIYTQYDNEQATFKYNTSSQRFESAYEWRDLVTTNYNNNNNNTYYGNEWTDLSTDDDTPATNQSVDLRVRTYRDSSSLDTSFNSQVRFYVYRLNSAGTYVTADNYYDYSITNDRYTFSTYDYGDKTLSDYIYFRTEWTYKVTVTNDRNNTTDQMTFYVGSSSNGWSTSNTATSFSIDLSDYTPDLSQSISTYTTAKDGSSTAYNYRGTVRYTLEKRDSNSSYWYSVSSNDYSLSPTSTYMGTSQQWYISLSSHFVIYRSGYYRIKAYDDSNSNVYGYREFEVSSNNGSSNSNSNWFLIDSNITNPSTNQSITTYTTARDNSSNRLYSYRGTVRYTVEKRDSNSSYRYTASSNDYYLSPTSTYMWSDQQGYVSLYNHLSFYNNGYYRIKAYDDSNSNIYGYREFTVGWGSSSSSSNGYFTLTTNDDTPGINNFASLSITARDSNWYKLSSYTNRVKFQVYRRMNTSDSWTDVTSSSLDNSYYRIYDTSYVFPYYENGDIDLTNFIRFYSDSYDYKVRVLDDTNNTMYGEIIFYLRNTNLWGSNSSSSNNNSSYGNAYRFVGEFYPLLPKEDTAADLKLYVRDSGNRTVTNYTRTVRFSVERKTSVWSSSRSSASSSYCDLDRSSYTFSSNDQWYVRLNDLIECKQKGFYRLKITDDTNNSVIGYIYLTIFSSTGFDSSVRGFSSTQLRTVRSLYSNFMSNVNAREMNNAGLAYDTEWTRTWTDLYEQLYNIVYDKSGRDVSDYDEYLNLIDDFNDDFYRLIR